MTPRIASTLIRSSTIVLGLLGSAVATSAPAPTQFRLVKPVEIRVDGVDIDAVAMLPDNETVIVVGGKPHDPDDRLLAIQDAPPAGAIINLRTRLVRSFENGHKKRIQSVACASDGSHIFTGSTEKDPFIRIWDVKAGKTINPIPFREEDVCGDVQVACLTGSSKIAVTLKKSLGVMDPANGGERLDFTDDVLSNQCPTAVAVSRENKFVACCSVHHDILIWDMKSKKLVYSTSLRPAGSDWREWTIHALAFTKDGNRLILARSGKAGEVPQGIAEEKVPPENRGLFVIDIGRKQTVPLGIGHQRSTNYFALHPSEEWIATVGVSRRDKPNKKDSSSHVRELRIYRFSTRSLVFRLQFDNDFFPFWVGFTSDGKKLIAVAFDGKVRCWDFVARK